MGGGTLKRLITVFFPWRFVRWSSYPDDGTCFDFFPLYAWHCTLKSAPRDDEALRRQDARFSFSFSSLSFLSYRGSNQPKESSCRSCPFGRLYRSSADSSILSDPPRCRMFFCSFSFSPCSRFLALIRDSFRLFPLCPKANSLPIPRMQKSSQKKYPLIIL